MGGAQGGESGGIVVAMRSWPILVQIVAKIKKRYLSAFFVSDVSAESEKGKCTDSP